MKKVNPPAFKLLLPAFLLLFIAAHAQKLPNVQQASLRAPDNVKIDGKANEWDGKFQAYNKATEIFYTIANDADNLYLVIQAGDPDIINKIYANGITFSIDSSGKKGNKNIISFTYPVFDGDNRFHMNIKSKPKIEPGSSVSVLKADSFMNVANSSMAAKAKWIRVNGVKGLDTLISIYNEDGIKGAALFDDQMVYTLELQVPLKYLGHPINNFSKFAYHIELHGLSGMNVDNVIRGQIRGPNGNMNPTVKMIGVNSLADIDRFIGMGAPTDFWGEYTLAKK